jgi:hypothetical protein
VSGPLRRRAPAITLATVVCPVAHGGPIHFTDVTVSAEITHVLRHDFYSHGIAARFAAGAVAEDFDGDGRIDLFAVQGDGSPCLLYINEGDGSFSDQAESRGASLSGPNLGTCAADFDNDGDIDMCVSRANPPHALLINDGTGHFTVDREMLTQPSAVLSTIATSPSWGDVDNDGLLELALGQWANAATNLWLYRNVGEGRLEAYEFHTDAQSDPFVFSPRFADVTGDRRQDLVVTSDFGQSQLYHGTGGGLFENVTPIGGAGVDENGMGSAIGDIDGDGDLDWFVSSTFPPPMYTVGNRLYQNRGDGLFDDMTEAAGVQDGSWGWSASFGDLDNDGDLDLYHVNGWATSPQHQNTPNRLFENLGDGTFTEVAAEAGAEAPGDGRGVILADFDDDGDLDIFVVNNQEVIKEGSPPVTGPGRPVLLRNDTVTDNGWLKVTLEADPPLHRHGIGSRVWVTTGHLAQMRELHASTNFMTQNPGRIAHFGLGMAAVADEIRAEWINGDATLFEDVPPSRQISLPSPTATVSSRTPLVGQTVIADGSTAEPVTAERHWDIEGQVLDDPATVSFPTPGAKELRLNLWEEDGTTLLRSEILRIKVVEIPAGIALD